MDQQREHPQSPRRVHAQHGIGDVAHPLSPNTAAEFARAKKRALEQRYRIAPVVHHDGINEEEDEIIWEPNEPRLPWESAVGGHHREEEGETNLNRKPLNELNSRDEEDGNIVTPLSPTMQRLSLAKAKQRQLRDRIANQSQKPIDFNKRSDNISEERQSGVFEGKDSLVLLAATKLKRVSGPPVPIDRINSTPCALGGMPGVRHSMPLQQTEHSSGGGAPPREIFLIHDAPRLSNAKSRHDLRKQTSSPQIRNIEHRSDDHQASLSQRELYEEAQQSRDYQNRILVNASERTDSTKSFSERSGNQREDTTRLQTRERQHLKNSTVRRSESRRPLVGGSQVEKVKPAASRFIHWILGGGAPRRGQNLASYSNDHHQMGGPSSMRAKKKPTRPTKKLKMLDPVRQLCTRSKAAKQVFSPDAHLASTEATAMMMDRLILSK